MQDVYVAGVGRTAFGKHTSRSHADLAREAVDLACADAGLVAGDIDAVVFTSCALAPFGQHSVRGPMVLAPLVKDGVLPDRPSYDVEAACASGSVAFHLACALVAGDEARTVLAIGVDKTFLPDMAQLGALFSGAFDRLTAESETRSVYERAAAELGVAFAPTPTRLLTVDVCALLALDGMRSQGLTERDLAQPAARAHGKSVDDVLADKPVLAPFTRTMCTGIADGAACAIVSSRPSERAPRVQVRARARTAGHRTSLSQPSVTERAARALRETHADLLSHVTNAEVHDATSYAHLHAVRALALDAACVVNAGGGLLKRGHPLAPTGLAQIDAVVKELRGRPSGRSVGLVHNAGGFAGLDEAVCALTLLERAA